MPRRVAIVAAPLALAALLLTGCAPEPRIPAAEPQPSSAALFASDDEALAAATAAYEEYLAVSERVASSWPFDYSPLEPLTTSEFLAREVEVLGQLESAGLRVEGHSALRSVALQQRYVEPSGGEVVTIYGCLDVSSGRVVDDQGVDRTPADRPSEISLEIELVEGDGNRLLVNRSDTWFDDSFC